MEDPGSNLLESKIETLSDENRTLNRCEMIELFCRVYVYA